MRNCPSELITTGQIESACRPFSGKYALLSGQGLETGQLTNDIDTALQTLRKRNQHINSCQEDAIRNCVKQGIHYVWGPPGTGKTANLSHVSHVISEGGERILVVAHANAAVDVAMLRIAESMNDHKLLRTGKILRIGFSQNSDVRNHDFLTVLGHLRQTEPDLLENLEFLEKQLKLLQTQISKSKNRSTQEQLDSTRNELSKLRSRIKEKEALLIDQAAIIGCTAAKAIIDERIWKRSVETVIIDEVSMMNFPYVVAMASRASNRILQFGDFRQLPPIVISENELALKWLNEDSFSCSGVTASVENNVVDKRITMLEEQYRMHSQICKAVSMLSYNDRLVTHKDVDFNVNRFSSLKPQAGVALVLADTTKFKSVCLKDSKRDSYSRVNPIHAVLALNLARNLISSQSAEVSIITPYKAQARLINHLAAEMKVKLKIETVHKFQGSEQDVVIFDLCDSFPEQGASQLTGNNPTLATRLINVAISRAKGKLIVLADRDFIFRIHNGRSPARKLCCYIDEFGRSDFLELDDLDSENSEIEWFEDFSSAQLVLLREFKACTEAVFNLPDGFHLTSQVMRCIDSMPEKAKMVRAPVSVTKEFSNQKVNQIASVHAGGFYALFNQASIIGGRSSDAPVVFMRGKMSAILRRLLDH